jgi:hypothetical protein
MPVDLDAFEPAYKKWVEESLPDYRAGNMKEIIKKYPFRNLFPGLKPPGPTSFFWCRSDRNVIRPWV